VREIRSRLDLLYPDGPALRPGTIGAYVGRALHQALRCASASTALDVQSDDKDRGGKISGTWTELSRNVGGELSGIATGRRIRAGVRGENSAANLSIVTDRDKQSIVITPEGSNVRPVAISLERR
jgi:hypothetical protein